VFILVLQHKDNKLLSIYAKIKSQDAFLVKKQMTISSTSITRQFTYRISTRVRN